jgi:hypothetical protein
MAAVALLGCGLLAAGCRGHSRLTKDDYVAEMRHRPLGRLVFGFSAQISSRNWAQPRARQHTLQRVLRRAARANRHLGAMQAVHPPQDVADLHEELVAAARRVNDAVVAETRLLRPHQGTRARTYATYLVKFEALQRKQEISSNAGDRAYFAIKRKGYDIGPSTIEVWVPETPARSSGRRSVFGRSG